MSRVLLLTKKRREALREVWSLARADVEADRKRWPTRDPIHAALGWLRMVAFRDANRCRDSYATTPESPGGPKDANRCPGCGNKNDTEGRECSRCAEGVKP